MQQSVIDHRRRSSSEIRHMEHIRKGGELRTALEWVNFSYTPEEEKQIRELWFKGLPVDEIAEEIKRPVDDVFVITWELLHTGTIKARPGNIWGCG